MIYSVGLLTLFNKTRREDLLNVVSIERNGSKLTFFYLFANDSIIFDEITINEMHTIKDVVSEYGQCSGQRVDFIKSLVYFGVNTTPKNKDVKRSVHWCIWSALCNSKFKGGLGFCDLQRFNSRFEWGST